MINKQSSDKTSRGKFIVIEGLDGSGKSTLAKSLSEHLNQAGKKTLLTRQPGGTNIGQKIREILLDKNNKELSKKTELLLFAADRAQHVDEFIKPNLGNGINIICDRYIYSNLVYQGLSPKFTDEEEKNYYIETINTINNIATSGLKPDLVIVLDLSLEKREERLSARYSESKETDKDRIELFNEDFHQNVRAGFTNLSHYFPEQKFCLINADKPQLELLNEALIQLERILSDES